MKIRSALSVPQVGESPDGQPIYEIGELILQEFAWTVTATMSRKNSMAEVGGWHIALGTVPTVPWSDAREYGLMAEHLSVVFRTHEAPVLAVLFPEKSEEELGLLACSTGHNSEFTANRPDVHAHVQVASKAVWASGNVRRMVDDARAPKLLMAEGASILQKNLDYQEGRRDLGDDIAGMDPLKK